MLRTAVACASYCWEAPSHPDPEGSMLLDLAGEIEACYRRKEV